MDEWKSKIVYQIWPRSFKDSNGDGIGDLKGIIQKLDYIKRLGIDLIWLSPIYLSPNQDYGYDISDYYTINPEFGTMEDFDQLLFETQNRAMGVVMDLVANHTSDQHPWFVEARSSKESPYRDYYIFKKGNEGCPPNNWMSFFGGSAWTYDEQSGDYYLTQFTPNQCDLNWENPQMRQEIYEVMKFWLDKGIAGFRMDVINAISKAEGLPNANTKKKGLQFPGELTLNREKTHEYIKEMYEEVLSQYDCLALGEGVLAKEEDVIKYTNPQRKELNMMFQFDLHNLGYGKLGKYDFRKGYRWRIKEFKQVLNSWQLAMQEGNGWIGNYLSNHDQNRQVSRFGDDQRYREESAKMLCLLNMTLRGTPFIYQGEEIGMTDCVLEPGEWKDYEALNAFEVLQTMMHVPEKIAEKIVKKVTRDNSRTPMQWNQDEYAGFTRGEPWISVNPNYKEINVAVEEKKRDSILKFYKDTIKFHKKHQVLIEGTYTPRLEKNPAIMGYIRENNKEKLLILINLTHKYIHIEKEQTECTISELIYTTHYRKFRDEDSDKLKFNPYEGCVYKIK